MSLAWIGGTGLCRLEGGADLEQQTVRTCYGSVRVMAGRLPAAEAALPSPPSEIPFFFLPRHGESHTVPPHRIPYRCHIAALKQLGVTGILASAASGCLNPAIAPGDLVLVSDFIDWTKQRELTFFDRPDGPVIHLDLTTPYCPRLRELVLRVAREMEVPLHPNGVYACTEGPRFETPAEIRLLQRLGADLVGMTNVPEVILAREAEICYVAIAIATNYAAGISPRPLTHTEVETVMEQRFGDLQRLFRRCAELYHPDDCSCRHALDEYRQRLGRPDLTIPIVQQPL